MSSRYNETNHFPPFSRLRSIKYQCLVVHIIHPSDHEQDGGGDGDELERGGPWQPNRDERGRNTHNLNILNGGCTHASTPSTLGR
jgi:hypothetical protein